MIAMTVRDERPNYSPLELLAAAVRAITAGLQRVRRT
jgi:hypothetical protein